jgi:hypothetical protein
MPNLLCKRNNIINQQQPIDIDTQWSENKTQLINEWITYSQQIVDLCTELKQRGGSSLDFPKRP